MEGHGDKALGLLSLHPGSSSGECVLGYIPGLEKQKLIRLLDMGSFYKSPSSWIS